MLQFGLERQKRSRIPVWGGIGIKDDSRMSALGDGAEASGDVSQGEEQRRRSRLQRRNNELGPRC